MAGKTNVPNIIVCLTKMNNNNNNNNMNIFAIKKLQNEYKRIKKK